VRAADRIARVVVRIGGIAIICAVLGITVFLFAQVVPLLRGACVRAVTPVVTGETHALLTIIDEHQERVLIVGREPVATIASLEGHETERIPLAGLDGQELSAVSYIPHTASVAFGTATGLIWTGSIELRTTFDGAQRTARPTMKLDASFPLDPGHRVLQLAYRETDAAALIAAVTDHAALTMARVTIQRPLVGPVRRTLEKLEVPTDQRGPFSALLINESCTQLLTATMDGRIIRWQITADGRLDAVETIEAVPHGSVTAMSYLIGERSIAVGGSDGSVATWSPVRDESSVDGRRVRQIHSFSGHSSRVVLICPSPRNKGFVSVSADGIAKLRYMTSERTLATFPVGDAPLTGGLTPKANGLLLIDGVGTLRRWSIDNPHPEFSWKALFGKVWYEGYDRPDYMWQSTGGSDDFEPKLSLVPLLFGTLKGACYALLFAVPLALFGALYCSQFLDKRLRNLVKSTIELMAALPSVVLGFIAGVVLAPLVARHIVAVLLLPTVIPLVTVIGMALCASSSNPTLMRLVRRYEFWMLLGWATIGAVLAIATGPLAERVFFHGDFPAWLLRICGERYDQRNALVVGWVMGFAVIPIIFTICEDACSAVPRHLVSASLACGASLWQTAWRVVLPAAGSGIFSGIMVGLGRAVGETMIVLMATGNTPVLDWSAFNGFRTLSANIAVEMPEAPYGGTLYRILFLSSLLLLLMTSIVNTAAELIRSRLRARLKGL